MRIGGQLARPLKKAKVPRGEFQRKKNNLALSTYREIRVTVKKSNAEKFETSDVILLSPD